MNKHYFSHDSNARNDPKLLRLRKDLSWSAIGIFWAIAESLCEATDYRLEKDYGTIAYGLHCDESTVKSIVEDYNLFVIDDEYFYSDSLNKRMAIKDAKSKKARQAANKRWNGNPAEDKPKEQNKIIQASERIVNKHPKVGLPIPAQVAVNNAIIREVESGLNIDKAIDLIENGTIQYAAEFIESNQFAKEAKAWYDGGGYMSVSSKPKNKPVINDSMDLIDEYAKGIK
jgi:hypothetical protein